MICHYKRTVRTHFLSGIHCVFRAFVSVLCHNELTEHADPAGYKSVHSWTFWRQCLGLPVQSLSFEFTVVRRMIDLQTEQSPPNNSTLLNKLQLNVICMSQCRSEYCHLFHWTLIYADAQMTPTFLLFQRNICNVRLEKVRQVAGSSKWVTAHLFLLIFIQSDPKSNIPLKIF